ncbi:hypothetical protein COOONC_17024, partial [Cooperia oncophora]
MSRKNPLVKPGFQQNFQPNFRPNPQPNFRPNPQSNFQPQFVPGPHFIPQQFLPQQFNQNYRTPNQGNNVVGQQPFNPNYPTNPQYPNGRFVYPPLQPGFPVVNNGRNQWFIPQNAFPYLEGSGPIPPQGIYGPTPTPRYTVSPSIPSVNPQNYQGTIPMQPSINPDQLTTPIASPTTDHGHTTRGWYNPTSTVGHGYVATTASANQGSTSDIPDMPHISESGISPFQKSSPATSSAATATPLENGPTRSSVDEELLKNFSPKGPVPPPASSSSATSSQPTPTPRSSESSELSATTPEYIYEVYDHTELYVEEAGTETAKTIRPTTIKEVETTHLPIPVSTQGYQPPGHLPEDFSKHIDVSFLKPNRTTCVGPLCGIDVDK